MAAIHCAEKGPAPTRSPPSLGRAPREPAPGQPPAHRGISALRQCRLSYARRKRALARPRMCLPLYVNCQCSRRKACAQSHFAIMSWLLKLVGLPTVIVYEGIMEISTSPEAVVQRQL